MDSASSTPAWENPIARKPYRNTCLANPIHNYKKLSTDYLK
jgi:hypothetical protein